MAYMEASFTGYSSLEQLTSQLLELVFHMGPSGRSDIPAVNPAN